MLEILDIIERLNEKEAFSQLSKAMKKYPKLPQLLKLYIVDENRIITPWKLYTMMKYFRVEKSSSLDKIGEIGNFVVSRMELIKKKELGLRNDVNTITIHMSNVQFLIDTYNKLKQDVLHKNQYKILKNCFLLLSPTDVKWFVRMLCRKLPTRKAYNEIILKAEVS